MDFGSDSIYKGNHLTFDADDQMTAYSDANYNLLLTAGYTGDGLRAWKAGADGTKTYFIYNGEDLLAETDANGNVLRYNTWGAGDLISRTEVANDASTFYQFDSEGNVVQRLDSTDTVLTTAVFDAWGNQVAGDNPTDPYGYKGEFGYYTDAET